jgi:hypothetical protein
MCGTSVSGVVTARNVQQPLLRTPGLLDEAVRVARGVPALQAGLVDAQAAKVVAVWEEARIDGRAAAFRVGVDPGRPRAYPVG